MAAQGHNAAKYFVLSNRGDRLSDNVSKTSSNKLKSNKLNKNIYSMSLCRYWT